MLRLRFSARWVLPPLHRAGEEDNSDAAFFCDDLHQALEQMLSGGGLASDAAASLVAAQVSRLHARSLFADT